MVKSLIKYTTKIKKIKFHIVKVTFKLFSDLFSCARMLR